MDECDNMGGDRVSGGRCGHNEGLYKRKGHCGWMVNFNRFSNMEEKPRLRRRRYSLQAFFRWIAKNKSTERTKLKRVYFEYEKEHNGTSFRPSTSSTVWCSSFSYASGKKQSKISGDQNPERRLFRGIPVVHASNLHFSDSCPIFKVGHLMNMKRVQWGKTDVMAKFIPTQLPNEMQDLTLRELDLLTDIHHPNILLLMGITLSDDLCVMTLFENVINGTMYSQIHEQDVVLKIHQVTQLMEEIVSAMTFLHTKNWIHTALSSHALLIAPHGHIKLTMFEFARTTIRKDDKIEKIIRQNLHYWLSPEQLTGGLPTKESDVYSVCIILYEMCTNQIPFHNMSALQLRDYYLTNKGLVYNPSDFPGMIQQILGKGLRLNPRSRRLDFYTILSILQEYTITYRDNYNCTSRTNTTVAEHCHHHQQKEDSKRGQAEAEADLNASNSLVTVHEDSKPLMAELKFSTLSEDTNFKSVRVTTTTLPSVRLCSYSSKDGEMSNVPDDQKLRKKFTDKQFPEHQIVESEYRSKFNEICPLSKNNTEQSLNREKTFANLASSPFLEEPSNSPFQRDSYTGLKRISGTRRPHKLQKQSFENFKEIGFKSSPSTAQLQKQEKYYGLSNMAVSSVFQNGNEKKEAIIKCKQDSLFSCPAQQHELVEPKNSLWEKDNCEHRLNKKHGCMDTERPDQEEGVIPEVIYIDDDDFSKMCLEDTLKAQNYLKLYEKVETEEHYRHIEGISDENREVFEDAKNIYTEENYLKSLCTFKTILLKETFDDSDDSLLCVTPENIK